MRSAFLDRLRCPGCRDSFDLESRVAREGLVEEGVLRSRCGAAFPVIAGVPRILPPDAAATLAERHAGFFDRHPDLRPATTAGREGTSVRTLRAFGDEWTRFPELLEVYTRIFEWYFQGPTPVAWPGLRVLDAGCGMGRWLHFARRAGAAIVGMDVSPAIDVVAQREGPEADLVQADLRWPPFAPGTFDLVYSLGVVHHLDDPFAGVRTLASLVRPGGELRLYVYRSLENEHVLRRALLGGVTLTRRVTTRLPFGLLHGFSWMVAAAFTVLSIAPRRLLRGYAWGDRLTRGLPLAQYADVPFGMLVAEQFDWFGAPLETRHREQDVRAWLDAVGFQVEAVLPELGWRAIGRRPAAS